MEYTFGRASLSDIAQLVQLRIGYLTADFGALNPQQEEALWRELPAYFELHLDFDLLAFVARDEEGTIVCCAWLLLPCAVGFAAILTGRRIGDHIAGKMNPQAINYFIYFLVAVSGLETLVKHLF